MNDHFLTTRLLLQTLFGIILAIGLWIVIGNLWPEVHGIHIMGPVLIVFCWRLLLATGLRPVSLILVMVISFVVAFTNPLRHGRVAFAAYVTETSEFWALLVGVVGMMVVRYDAKSSDFSPSAATRR